MKDALNLIDIMDIHNQLVETHVRGGALDRTVFRKYFGVVEQVLKRVRKDLKQDGNAGVYYKLAGEMYVLGSSCNVGTPLLEEATQLFAAETSIDTSGLMKQCTDLIAYCNGTHPDLRSAEQGVRGPGKAEGRRPAHRASKEEL